MIQKVKAQNCLLKVPCNDIAVTAILLWQQELIEKKKKKEKTGDRNWRSRFQEAKLWERKDYR